MNRTPGRGADQTVREAIGPPLRAAALTALVVGLVVLLLNPPSLGGLNDLLVLVAGALAIILVTAWLTVALIGKEMSEPDFQRLVRRSETLASMPPPDGPPSEFDELVMQALDELPEEFQRLLDHTPVIVSERGEEHRAYGQYIGGTVARDSYPDRIIIYQDTLERDFGHDPDMLRAQVQRTVRHELAHHLGWNEHGVRGLGL
jgi:predicted Zn-dependent protease with MMP-like domain